MLTASITAAPQSFDLVASLVLGFLTALLVPGLTQAMFRDQARQRRAWFAGGLTLTLIAAVASLLFGIRWNIATHYTDPSIRANALQGASYSLTIGVGLFLGLRWMHRQKP